MDFERKTRRFVKDLEEKLKFRGDFEDEKERTYRLFKEYFVYFC